MDSVDRPSGSSFIPPEFPRGDQEASKKTGGVSPQSDKYLQSDQASSQPSKKRCFARSIRPVPVRNLEVRRLLKSDHFRDVENALESGDIRADDRDLELDQDEIKQIIEDIQTKAAKKEIVLGNKFSRNLKKHSENLDEVDLNGPKELARIIVGLMNDLRKWHFSAGYDKTLITGKQLIDSEGQLRDILRNYSVGGLGEAERTGTGEKAVTGPGTISTGSGTPDAVTTGTGESPVIGTTSTGSGTPDTVTTGTGESPVMGSGTTSTGSGTPDAVTTGTGENPVMGSGTTSTGSGTPDTVTTGTGESPVMGSGTTSTGSGTPDTVTTGT
ncbi:hypothetical protein, partial [Endozoicomonas atrinae]|uniref:hypothetical protein n=1 Tax=Endozoicomonas atrinae TaxID=1333660 RepID=UPI001930EF7D